MCNTIPSAIAARHLSDNIIWRELLCICIRLLTKPIPGVFGVVCTPLQKMQFRRKELPSPDAFKGFPLNTLSARLFLIQFGHGSKLSISNRHTFQFGHSTISRRHPQNSPSLHLDNAVTM
ncbi:uncharacterized protein LOC119656078 [Hermetia illucens]|uniref:uncharacterized protein LOC119656078 n=1 Tax=Hermetia illucens TaxID=343691 RepID=UPI0018CC037B|nr:uncharacterized protein LOC119656078 [Hermetia illucens]